MSRTNLPAIAESFSEHFGAGAEARAASEVIGVKTATAFVMRLCQLNASNLPSDELSGEDGESYFRGVRKGTRAHAQGKRLFGLLKARWQGLYGDHPECETETSSRKSDA